MWTREKIKIILLKKKLPNFGLFNIKQKKTKEYRLLD